MTAVGDRIGEYVLERSLGVGSQATVFVGRHVRLGVRHGVKVLTLPNAFTRERFAREARALARLDGQPGILRVFHYEVFGDGRAYFSFDFVEGTDLKDVLKRGPLDVQQGLRLGEQVARALSRVHAAGIVHRDLKPENILLREGTLEPVLADFGVARDEADDRLTATHQIVGTVTYMAPEQLRGERDQIGPKTDVFGLGVVLYEALTGSALYAKETIADVAEAVLNQAPPPPSALRPELSPDVDRVLLRALEKDPVDRPTALELAESLAHLARGHADSTGPRRRRRPRRWLTALAALASLSVTAGLTAVVARERADLESAAAERASADARTRRLRAALSALDPIARDAALTEVLAEHPDDDVARRVQAAERERAAWGGLAEALATEPAEQRVGRVEAWRRRHPEFALGGSALRAARRSQRVEAYAQLLTRHHTLKDRREGLEVHLKRYPDDARARRLHGAFTPWRRREDQVQPPRRRDHGAAYDAARGELVVLGGEGQDGLLGDMWILGSAQPGAGKVGWRARQLGASPQPRAGHAMIYDAARKVTIVFGGRSAEGELGDTWLWDGKRWKEQRLEQAPPARSGSAVAYDAARREVILFGGQSGDRVLNDTWTWDGARWARAAPERSPPARAGHRLAYHAERRVTLLYGGSKIAGAEGERESWLDDTWTWDGRRWAPSPGPAPAARRDHVMAYLPQQRVVIVSGGRDWHAWETWAWDGSWTRRWPRVYPRYGLFQATLAHDSARRALILFGGGDHNTRGLLARDTYQYGAPSRR